MKRSAAASSVVSSSVSSIGIRHPRYRNNISVCHGVIKRRPMEPRFGGMSAFSALESGKLTLAQKYL
jgi:hypothetical protein